MTEREPKQFIHKGIVLVPEVSLATACSVPSQFIKQLMLYMSKGDIKIIVREMDND